MQSSIQIEETAAEWIARRAGADWSEADQVELERWLEASTANRVAFVRLDTAWREAARLKALRAGANGLPAPGILGERRFFSRWHRDPLPGATSSPGRRPWPKQWAIAASFLIAIVVIAGWFLVAPRGESYSTVVGGLQTVPLSDGSQVTLNTNTEIRIAMTESERRVELAQGEAFFEVAKDPTRPFVVSAGDRRVLAVGTKFSVLRVGDEFRVIVTEGQVRVERDGGEGTPQPIAQLAPGNIARALDADVLIQEKPVSQAEELLSWRSGFLVFHDATLSEAVTEFNRYSTRKILIEDPSIARTRIGGHFRSTNSEAFLRLLEEGFPLVVERHSDRITLTAAKGA